MKVFEQLGLAEAIEGEVGIEVEVEGRNLPRSDIGRLWNTTTDGSLRGESREFVLDKPCGREQVGQVLEVLRARLEEFGAEVIPSNRCGVHVHINCQNLTTSQVVSFITTYMCLEEVLVKWCGQERVGNLFCLRTSDAEGMMKYIHRFIRTGRIHQLYTDRIRYASVNMKALPNYGSLEFRAMRSDLTPGVIEKWVAMLLAVKDYSLDKRSDEIIGQFSMKGPQDFFNDVLGDFREDLNPQEEDLTIGMRNAQEVAFYV